MIEISESRLNELFGAFRKCRLAVLGDFMVDKYIWGRVSRISPEAPVPVVEVESESLRFGGAANVALNVASLGAEVLPIGLIGPDAAGAELKILFEEKGFQTEGLLQDDSRPTTVKTRIIADCQHVVRADWEQTHPVSDDLRMRVMSILEDNRDRIDGIILEDYNKGLLVPELIGDVVEFAGRNELMTFVDPKYDHFFEYRDVTLFKPNRKEAADRLAMKLKTEADLNRAAEKLFNKLNCRSILITLSEEGMMLFENGKAPRHVHTRAVKVHDVSGAGDTVIATMAVGLSSGATFQEAATLANHAAGIVCGEVGIVPIAHEQLFREMISED